MTRQMRRWVRAGAVATICAGTAILYSPRAAHAGSTCPASLQYCAGQDVCNGGQSFWWSICDGQCMKAGGSSCVEAPLFFLPPTCTTNGCGTNNDALTCHCVP